MSKPMMDLYTLNQFVEALDQANRGPVMLAGVMDFGDFEAEVEYDEALGEHTIRFL